MRNLIKLCGLILAFGFSSGCTCLSQRVSASSDEQKSCKSDDDCVLFAADCCGCNQGGKQSAINKKFAAELNKAKQQSCSTTVCMQMISNDPSCKATGAACLNGSCGVSK